MNAAAGHLLPLLFLLPFESCDNMGVNLDGPFESMKFERKGGGDLAFTLVPAPAPYVFTARVTRLEFRDTLIALGIVRAECDSAASEALTQALAGNAEITGDFRQSVQPTGTWAYVYMVTKGFQREVTNVELRNHLLTFESVIRKRMQIVTTLHGA